MANKKTVYVTIRNGVVSVINPYAGGGGVEVLVNDYDIHNYVCQKFSIDEDGAKFVATIH